MAEFSSSSGGKEKAEGLAAHQPSPLIPRYRPEGEKRLLGIYSSDGWISAAASEAARDAWRQPRSSLPLELRQAIDRAMP